MSIVEKGLASSAGVGVSAARPDGKEKVKGNFLFCFLVANSILYR